MNDTERGAAPAATAPPAPGVPPAAAPAAPPGATAAGGGARVADAPEGRGRLRLRRAARVTAPLVAGALVALSLPPFGAWPTADLGVAALWLLLRGRRARSRALVGWAFGIGQFAIGLAWAWQFSSPGYVVLVLVEAGFVALACALVPARRHGPNPFALAGALTLAEWARESWPFGGLPLGGIALGQAAGPLLSVDRLGGPLLVAGCAYLAGAGLGALLGAPRAPRRLLEAGFAALVVVIGLGVAGALAPRGGAPVGELRAAIVQGGGRRGLDQLQVPPSVVFDAAVAPTERLRPGPALVLWPEDVVALDGPLAGSPQDAVLSALARRLHATLVAGVTEPVGTRYFRNEVVAYAPDGRIVATFEKVHRVPFGEYVPDRSFFSHLANLRDVPRDAIPGHGSGEITTPAGRFAVLVSFEVFFADRGRSGVRAGGQLILVPTNTSSYSNDQAPSQEIAASRLQAVAEGRDLLQAAPTGYSAVIDEDGRVLARSRLSVRAVIETTVPLRRGLTVFGRVGTRPVLGLAALAIALPLALAVPSGLADARRRRAGRRRDALPLSR
jgi:apolipoprotein N-acyltransferase